MLLRNLRKIYATVKIHLKSKNFKDKNTRAQRVCTFDISAERNVWLQPALRSFAIISKQLSLRSSVTCDALSSAIIRKSLDLNVN